MVVEVPCAWDAGFHAILGLVDDSQPGVCRCIGVPRVIFYTAEPFEDPEIDFVVKHLDQSDVISPLIQPHRSKTHQ